MAEILGTCYNSSGSVVDTYEFKFVYEIENTNENTLNTWLYPAKFLLRFTKDQDNTFTGTVTVKGTIKDNTNTSVLNIDTTASVDTDGTYSNDGVVVYDLGGAGFTIHHNESTGAGSFTIDLTIEYTGSSSSSFGKATINKTTSVTGFNIYVATKGTDEYANSNCSPTQGTYNSSFTITATSNANNETYIYKDLTICTYPKGVAVLNETVVKSGYANGYGKNLTGSTSNTFGNRGGGVGGFVYYAKSTPVSANPGWLNNISETNITANTATITIPTGLTTTFLNNNYYIVTEESSSGSGGASASTCVSSISGYKSFSRNSNGSGSISLTGLLPSTTYDYPVYAYNSYNSRYYQIGNAYFTTLAETCSYSSISSSNITPVSAKININGFSSTATLNNVLYATKTKGSYTSMFTGSISGSNASVDITGLNSLDSYTYYLYAKSSVTNNYIYIGSCSFTAAKYSATITSEKSKSTVSIYINDLNYAENLNTMFYLSLTDVESTHSLTDDYITTASVSSSNNTTLYGGITANNLYPSVKYIFNIYVYKKTNEMYYKIGSVTTRTNPNVYYYKDGQFIPCMTYRYINGSFKEMVFGK